MMQPQLLLPWSCEGVELLGLKLFFCHQIVYTARPKHTWALKWALWTAISCQGEANPHLTTHSKWKSAYFLSTFHPICSFTVGTFLLLPFYFYSCSDKLFYLTFTFLFFCTHETLSQFLFIYFFNLKVFLTLECSC